MTRYSTLDPPAAISYFTPYAEALTTNVYLGLSLFEQRVRSAFENADKELARYAEYLPRWDGYTAEPFDPEVLDEASKILTFAQSSFIESGVIPSLVSTGPASDGSVDVEMRVGDRRVLMTLYPTDRHLHLAWSQANELREDVAPLRTEVVGQWLDWLYGAHSLPASVDQDPIHP